MALYFFILSLIISVGSCQSQELLKNADFETLDNWRCDGAHCELTNERHSGKHAVKITRRTMAWQGPAQYVTVTEGHSYNMVAWVKILSDNGKFQNLQMETAYDMSNGHKVYKPVVYLKSVSSRNGWMHLEGQFTVPSGVSQTKVYFQGPDPGIDFIVDSASLTLLPIDDDWKDEANARIEKIRKSNIHFRVSLDDGVSDSSVTLEISQKTHSFPFGTAVVASIMNKNDGGSDEKYRQFIYDNYNWAVIENALKWRQIERQKGHTDYVTGEKAIRTLLSHGLKVRAHNLLWAGESHLPSWLRSLPTSEIKTVTDKHIRETVLHYKGLVEHWDVNNELLHGHFYEEKFSDPDYTKKVFRLVHQLDPNVTLFLNDFSVVAGGSYTSSYLEQAKDFKSSNTYVGGLGVQCHFHEAPVPAIIKKRLDILSEAGLPIWATELDVSSSDEHQRADWYETAYRMLFSYPSVEGILTWGFWSEHKSRGESAALVSGPEFRINEAGRRYLRLVNEEWRTRVTHDLSKGKNFSVRGFHGDYEVVVKVNGKRVHNQEFSLGKSGATVNVRVSSTQR